ncbi:MAG: YwaF family protein [Lachnospiraceae bacterium]|nr:YwaF family protein [Lachnospiraceae bacterium]
MYAFISELLSDKKSGTVFSCFGLWHLCYLLVAIAVVVITIAYLKNKDKEQKEKVSARFINLAFGLYIADIFLMPFAYGEVDVEKLPFHACTAMCVMCFWSRHNAFLGRYKRQFALLGFVSNLVYLIYPAGLMWYQVHPLSYRVIQTLLFHGLMTVYGLLVLLFGGEEFDRKCCYRDLAVIVCMTLWALIGNALYSGQAWGHTNDFNWFFVMRDPFYIIPANIAPYIMPLINIILFFAVELLVNAIFSKIRRVILWHKM